MIDTMILQCPAQAERIVRCAKPTLSFAAGTGNCLRAVRLLAPAFNRASWQRKVGKILEADTRLHYLITSEVLI